ncbi:MAG: aspartate aminotransferase family protein [Spirochaetota bacterium]
MSQDHDLGFEDIRMLEDRYQLNTYAKLPLALERGEGMYVYDSNGRRYLDLYGGHAVTLTGHCHPVVVQAVAEQIRRLMFYSNVVYSSVRAAAARDLVEAAPEPIDRVFFCNSGAEANETAMKIARRFTGRDRIIAMQGGFHGRTIGALSATALGDYREMFTPLVEGYSFVKFGSLEAVERDMDKDTAGVLLEPIQSMAGVEMAEDEYYRGLRELCTRRGAMLIFDEVQTGLGRTGTWFFGDRMDVVPDLITLAKGIGGGIPVGGVLLHESISRTVGRGEHGSTFGGGQAAAAAISANIRVLREEGLVENAARMGAYLVSRLAPLDLVRRVRGRGLLLGVELACDAKPVRDYLLKQGIITGTSYHPSVLRLLPPLILMEKEADRLVDALKGYRE